MTDPLTWDVLRSADHKAGNQGHGEFHCPQRLSKALLFEVCVDRGLMRVLCEACNLVVVEVLIAAQPESRTAVPPPPANGREPDRKGPIVRVRVEERGWEGPGGLEDYWRIVDADDPERVVCVIHRLDGHGCAGDDNTRTAAERLAAIINRSAPIPLSTGKDGL